MTFSFQSLSISDVILIEPVSYMDERGYFLENFHQSIFEENNIKTKFVQDNFSYSKKMFYVDYIFKKIPNLKQNLYLF